MQGHFVVSMLLVLDAVVLAHRASLPDDVAVRPVVTPSLLRWGRVLLGTGALVLVTTVFVLRALRARFCFDASVSRTTLAMCRQYKCRYAQGG